jgi:hypothetical protein
MESHGRRGEQPPRNWFLILMLVICVEFWVLVTSALAQNF